MDLRVLEQDVREKGKTEDEKEEEEKRQEMQNKAGLVFVCPPTTVVSKSTV